MQTAFENSQKFSAYALEFEVTWSGGKYQEGNVVCVSDEVYVEPKGAICVSLAPDTADDADEDGDTTDLIGLTHRLNDAEWQSFRKVLLINDLQEATNVFVDALPEPLTAISSEN